MNYANIIQKLAEKDPEFFERTSQRRRIIKNWTRNVALTALPLALGSLFNKAYGKGTSDISDALMLALNLEYLESTFYNTALDGGANQSAIFSTPEQQNCLPGFMRIKQDENNHVAQLTSLLTGMGHVPAGNPNNFDFTGGYGVGSGPYADVFSNFDTFLAVSQAFEDTGVRAYKGAAPALVHNDVLTAALNIHSVEARHAAFVRTMRSERPWIKGTSSTLPATATGVYTLSNSTSRTNEANTMQGGVNIMALSGLTFTITADDASGAFDEPLVKDDIQAIVLQFNVQL